MHKDSQAIPDTHSGLRLAAPPYQVQCRTVHGYRRAFVHTGSGPALLLIHGIGNDLSTWNEVIADLARDHTVIAPDLLGHGRSEKPRADYSVAAYANGMRDLLSVLDIERVTVVGHSLGGGVATQFAYQYPARCERLVLVSSGGVARDVHPLLRLATVPAADVAMGLVQAPLVEQATRWTFALLSALDHDIAIDRDIVLAMLDGLRHAAARRAFVRTLRSVVDLRGQVVTMLDRCYLAADMPTLLVWGARDAVIPLEHGKLAHAAMPGSRLEVFEGAGHFPHRREPQRFVTLLRDFLATTEPSRHDVAAWRNRLRAGRPGSLSSLPLSRAM
ncbi:MAG: alpha/beta fold hydrolase [Polyangiales bacterium]